MNLLVTSAIEPTSVVWENQHIRGSILRKRLLIGAFWCMLILLSSFILILSCTKYQINLDRKYVSTDCTELANINTQEQLLDLSGAFYLEQLDQLKYHKGKEEVPEPKSGILKCFCNN